MAGLFVIGILLCLSYSTGSADEVNLAGGSLIVHHPPDIQYTHEPVDWCEEYEAHAIQSVCEQNPRTDVVETIWYVLAAWDEDKVFCGVDFGFGDYAAEIFTFADWGPCHDGIVMEISSDNWPGPNEGSAFSVADDYAWAGGLVPVYYFAGYAESEGIIPLDASPFADSALFCNCLYPPELYEVECLGGMGLFWEGVACGASPTATVPVVWGGIKKLYR